MEPNADVYDESVALPSDPAQAFLFQDQLLGRLQSLGYTKETPIHPGLHRARDRQAVVEAHLRAEH